MFGSFCLSRKHLRLSVSSNTFIIKITHLKFLVLPVCEMCHLHYIQFHNISKFPLNCFLPYKLISQDKRLAAILIQKFRCCVPHSIIFLAAGNIIAKQHLVWWVLYLLPLMSLQFFFFLNMLETGIL